MQASRRLANSVESAAFSYFDKNAMTDGFNRGFQQNKYDQLQGDRHFHLMT